MSYNAITFVAFEVLTAANMNILGANDADFYSRIGKASMPVQQIVNTTSTAVSTTTTIIPTDNTIPQNTEGAEFMSLSITPKSSTNILVIQYIVMGAVNLTIGNGWTAALFQDTTANALAAAVYSASGSGHMTTMPQVHTMAAGTTSATTFKVRCGPGASGTFTFNGSGGSGLFGAITKSSIVITEYLTPAV